jgi:hypothetical protein
VKLVQGSIAIYEGLEKGSMKPLLQMKRIHEALGDTLRLDELKMTRHPAPVILPDRPPPTDAQGNVITPRPSMEAVMQLSFPPTINPEDGAREVTNLERRLKAAFPGYAVKIDKQVADMVYTESVSGEAGAGAKERTEDYIAVLSIKGDL